MKKIKTNKKILYGLFIFSLLLTSYSVYAEDISERVKGKILLQVESNGEAWYVNPDTDACSYMGQPEDAFEMMREQGVGISNENLQKIPIGDSNLDSGIDSDGDGLSDTIEDAFGSDKNNQDSDGDGIDDKTEMLNGYDPNNAASSAYLVDNNFAASQSGRILLQVESNGEAWYVNPDDNKRYFLSRPSDAFAIMRSLGLGISNNDLSQIQTQNKETNTQNSNTNNPEEHEPKGGGEGMGDMTNACENLSEGDTCEMTNPNGDTMTGTCETGMNDELMCRGEDMGEPGGEPRGGGEGMGDMTNACENLSEGDTCEMTNPNGDTMTGTCETGMNDELMCRPEKKNN